MIITHFVVAVLFIFKLSTSDISELSKSPVKIFPVLAGCCCCCCWWWWWWGSTTPAVTIFVWFADNFPTRDVVVAACAVMPGFKTSPKASKPFLVLILFFLQFCYVNLFNFSVFTVHIFVQNFSDIKCFYSFKIWNVVYVLKKSGEFWKKQIEYNNGACR